NCSSGKNGYARPASRRPRPRVSSARKRRWRTADAAGIEVGRSGGRRVEIGRGWRRPLVGHTYMYGLRQAGARDQGVRTGGRIGRSRLVRAMLLRGGFGRMVDCGGMMGAASVLGVIVLRCVLLRGGDA